MRRTKILLAILLTMIICSCSVCAFAAEQEEPTRAINVVYDDSGSMISNAEGTLVDTWCQAKYAMEVFAALLGKNDTMNVYVMSDFCDGDLEAGPKLILNGSDGQEANVAKVHAMLTEAGNTPFASVIKAYSDLTNIESDEKWLVVLTDGKFQGVDDIDAFFSKKNDDINVMFLGMGEAAASITEDHNRGIFLKKAATSSHILTEITDISTRIFNSNRLDVNVSAKTVSFDVPMAELVVFAQGANVEISGITDSAGKKYNPSTLPVTVQYSQQAATNYQDIVIAKELKGMVATFKDDFAAGDYTINVSGANTIEVYYKPNIEISAYLLDDTGKSIPASEGIRSGQYVIDFGFVEVGTNERVSQSALLGDVSFSAVVTNNGNVHGDMYYPGDTINIDEGTLEIDATSYYLEYNSVSTHLSYSVYEDKQLALAVVASPEYTITKDGADVSAPIQIEAKLEGQPLTEEQWNDMGLINISKGPIDEGPTVGSFKVEKSSSTGIYNVYPVLFDGELDNDIYQSCSFTASYDQKHGDSAWTGKTEGTATITDARSWLDRNFKELIKYIIFGIIVVLVLGYIPPFKKYLPKRLKKRPSIDCSPNRPGVRAMTAKGKYTKKWLTALIPYKAEEGSIRFVPPGVSGVPVMQVRAAGGNAMFITNVKSFSGKENITFDGSPIDDLQKRAIRKGAGVNISVNTMEMTYTCMPNQ